MIGWSRLIQTGRAGGQESQLSVFFLTHKSAPDFMFVTCRLTHCRGIEICWRNWKSSIRTALRILETGLAGLKFCSRSWNCFLQTRKTATHKNPPARLAKRRSSLPWVTRLAELRVAVRVEDVSSDQIAEDASYPNIRGNMVPSRQSRA